MDRTLDNLQFDSVSALIHMDGHGAFVWAAYAITFVVLLGCVLWPRVTCRNLIAAAKGRAQRINQSGQVRS